MSLIARKSVRCDARLTRTGGSTACRGWTGASATAREARRIARGERWQFIADPDDPSVKIDVCPPCAFERERIGRERAEAAVRAARQGQHPTEESTP